MYNPKDMAHKPSCSYNLSKFMFYNGGKVLLGFFIAWLTADFWMELIPDAVIGGAVIIVVVFVILTALNLLWHAKHSKRPPHFMR